MASKNSPMNNMRWLLVLLAIVALILSGCSKSDITVVDSHPPEDAMQVDTVKTREVSFIEDNTTYKGIQYDIILTSKMTDSLLNQIGVGLQFKGETQQFWGKSDSGYTNGYSILEQTETGTKILVSIVLVKNSATDEEIKKFKGEEALRELGVKLFHQGELYTTLTIQHQ